MLAPAMPCDTDSALMWTYLVHQPAPLLPGAAADKKKGAAALTDCGRLQQHGHRQTRIVWARPMGRLQSRMLRLPCDEAHVALSLYWCPSCFQAAAGDAWHGRSICGHV
jgi:hypothetical protein